MTKDVNTDQIVADSGVVSPAPTDNVDVSQVTTDKGVKPDGDVTQEATAAPAETACRMAQRYPVFIINDVGFIIIITPAFFVKNLFILYS